MKYILHIFKLRKLYNFFIFLAVINIFFSTGISHVKAFTVNDVASTFGGGGHQFAAGCKISNLTSVEIESKILNLLKTKMG